jgi:hypothetical protein
MWHCHLHYHITIESHVRITCWIQTACLLDEGTNECLYVPLRLLLNWHPQLALLRALVKRGVIYF